MVCFFGRLGAAGRAGRRPESCYRVSPLIVGAALHRLASGYRRVRLVEAVTVYVLVDLYAYQLYIAV